MRDTLQCLTLAAEYVLLTTEYVLCLVPSTFVSSLSTQWAGGAAAAEVSSRDGRRAWKAGWSDRGSADIGAHTVPHSVPSTRSA